MIIKKSQITEINAHLFFMSAINSFKKDEELDELSSIAVSLEFGFMISGVVVVEVIFAWPGLGRTIFDAIANRDIPLVQAAVVVISVFVIIINLITDLVYAKLDPRIKL